eukprot:1191183-Pyramimonas_sp.AAC.1
MADWNMTLDEVGPSGFDTYVGGEWITAGPHPNGERVIDYMCISDSLRYAVNISWDDASPWAAPHHGIKGVLAKSAFTLQQRVALAPIPIAPGMHGPDLPWEHFCTTAAADAEEGMAKPGMQELVGREREVSMSYMTFALAAEALLLNRE